MYLRLLRHARGIIYELPFRGRAGADMREERHPGYCSSMKYWHLILLLNSVNAFNNFYIYILEYPLSYSVWSMTSHSIH